ncbi:DUF3172 domain-containing protein [Nostoc sp. CHAB 5836]|nr:DUF3172 domain-containing protein [Nostoc sp. CHAB 5836]
MLPLLLVLSPKNVFRSNHIDNTAFNADVCVQYDISAIVTDPCVFVILNL